MEPKEPKRTSSGLTENDAALRCDVGWWVSGIVLLLLEEDNDSVRFHSRQSIIVFGAATLLLLVFSWIPIVNHFMPWIIALISVALWIVLMVKAYQGVRYKLWAAGDLAEHWAGAPRQQPPSPPAPPAPPSPPVPPSTPAPPQPPAPPVS